MGPFGPAKGQPKRWKTNIYRLTAIFGPAF